MCVIAGDVMKSTALLLAELVEEDLGIDRAFPRFLHVVKEEKHGRSQRLRTGQRYRQRTLRYQETEYEPLLEK